MPRQTRSSPADSPAKREALRVSSVSGEVAALVDQRPLRGLIVQAFHVERENLSWLRNARAFVGRPSSQLLDAPLLRLGSGMTDSIGSFRISYHLNEAERPNIVLVVTSSQGECEDGSAVVLHISTDPRTESSEEEWYRVLLRDNVMAGL